MTRWLGYASAATLTFAALAFSVCTAVEVGICGQTSNDTKRYGVCAHVTWHEFETRGKAFAMMQAAGMDYVRSDFQYWRCRPKKPGEAWSFGMYDQVVDEAGERGITVLPILMYQSNWGREEFGRHEGEWTAFVRETARHFRGRIPVYEVCNEPNLHSFWNNPNPVNYLAALKTAYRAIK